MMNPTPRKRFTKQEAKALLGRTVRSIAALASIPAGTTGRVVELDEAGDGYHVVVEWDMRIRGRLPRDWFAKDEYDYFLTEA